MIGVGGVALLLPWALAPGALLTLAAGAVGRWRFGRERGRVTWTATLVGMSVALVALGVAWSLAPALVRSETGLATLIALAAATGPATAGVMAGRAGAGPAVVAAAAALAFVGVLSPFIDFVTSCLTGVSFFMGSQC